MRKRGEKKDFWNLLKAKKEKPKTDENKDEVLNKLKKMAEEYEKTFSKKGRTKKSVKKVASQKESITRKKRLKKIKKPLSLVKPVENPLISPRPENGWESWQTFNPGAVLLDEKIHFLYRAIGHDGVSRLGYANSNDGLKINQRLSNPAYEHKLENN